MTSKNSIFVFRYFFCLKSMFTIIKPLVSYSPPKDVKIQSVKENDITLSIQLHLEDDYTTHLRFHIASNRETQSSTEILSVNTRGVYILDGLKQLTEYTVKVASGNGIEFGHYCDEIKVTTKGICFVFRTFRIWHFKFSTHFETFFGNL